MFGKSEKLLEETLEQIEKNIDAIVSNSMNSYLGNFQKIIDIEVQKISDIQKTGFEKLSKFEINQNIIANAQKNLASKVENLASKVENLASKVDIEIQKRDRIINKKNKKIMELKHELQNK